MGGVFMGILGKISKAIGLSKELNIEEFMSATEAEDVDVLHQQADFYVKPVTLQSDSDVKVVEEELKQRNLILLNLTPMVRNPAKLKAAVNELKLFTNNINGDMARITEDKILLTPGNVKIVKRKKGR
jgi:SepF-like predicted cell division protein (DUF552 family)